MASGRTKAAGSASPARKSTPGKEGSSPRDKKATKSPGKKAAARKMSKSPKPSDRFRKVRRNKHLLPGQASYKAGIMRQFVKMRSKGNMEATSISSAALNAINSSLNSIGSVIGERARELNTTRERRTIGHETVESALSLVFSGELRKAVVSASRSAVAKFTNAGQSGSLTRKGASAKLGIELSIFGGSQRRLLAGSAKGSRVSQKAFISLAAVLDYLNETMLGLAAYEADSNKKKRIKLLQLAKGISSEEFILELFQSQKIMIPGVYNTEHKLGVHNVLVNSKSKAGAHLREVRKVQKNHGCLRIARALFARIARRRMAGLGPEYSGLRFSSGAMLAVQSFCEAHLVEMFKAANLICLENGRKGVQVRDLKLADKIMRGDLSYEAGAIASSKKEAGEIGGAKKSKSRTGTKKSRTKKASAAKKASSAKKAPAAKKAPVGKKAPAAKKARSAKKASAAKRRSPRNSAKKQ